MKLTGLILIILILALNGMPCCADNCTEANSSENHTESGTGEVCSPFFNCGTCTGLVYYGESWEQAASHSDFKENIPLIMEKNYSEYINCIWQPPKTC